MAAYQTIEIQGTPTVKNSARAILSHVSLHTKKGGLLISEIVLNKVPVSADKTAGSVVIDKKTMYVCEQCGRLLNRKIKAYGHVYCYKHYHQMKKLGKFLDDNPRTTYDRNEIHIVDDTAYVYVFDKYCNHIATGVCDAEDVPKIRYVKWKLSASGYLCNTPKTGSNLHFSRVVLNTDQFVDHINHNTLDNRKQNLRIVTKAQNQMNSNYRGVDYRENGTWIARIKLHGKALNLGSYVFKEEALFARWYAETLLFKEYRYPKEKPFILPDREKQIKSYVEKKVQRL